MILTAGRKSDPAVLVVGATVEGEADAPMLFCGLLFVKAGRKSNRLALWDADTKEKFHVRLPRHLLRRETDVAVKNIELELIE